MHTDHEKQMIMKLMKYIRFLVCLLSGIFVFETAQAALEAGKCYQILNVQTGCALSNLGNGNNNARLYVDQPSVSNPEQVWQLVRHASVADNNVFQIFNSYFHSAVDLALQSTSGPLQWSLATSAGQSLNNQLVRFLPVAGREDTYRLLANDGSTYIAADNMLSLVLTKDGNSEYTIFKLTEVDPVEVEKNAWEDETFFEENKERGHATFMPYRNTELLRADAERYKYPWLEPAGADYLSLAGNWKINYVSSPDKRPGEADFWGDAADVSSWDEVVVPGCLEMQGYGEPMYINVDYPFADAPPFIRMKSGLSNSVASLRREFALPADWLSDRRVFLHFDGIYGAAFVWINGNYAGYTQGANNVSEFDVSNFVRQGVNNVSVQIIRFSDGSYLEGQDMWHMTGIHRDVWLYATPRTFVSDFKITSTVTPPTVFTGLSVMKGKVQPTVEVDVCNRDKLAAQRQILVRLLSPTGAQLQAQQADVAFAQGDSLKSVKISFPQMSSIELWNAETPSLYTFEIVQLNDGKEEMAFQAKYGFRTIDIADGTLKVNGRRVYLKGVNSQDTHPLTGRTVDSETLEQDIRLMKQANVNCLRTSHYPRQSKMMAMLDYYGLYVVDEADMECHKNWSDHQSLTGDDFISAAPSWKAAVVDRSVRMVLRDRNYASVIMWSLGNESGAGENTYAAYNAVEALDDRPIHYEGATRAGTFETDVWSVMYPSVSDVKDKASYNYLAQPFFACEYAHAMGNAIGNLKEYWDEIIDSEYGIGGCIWDWVDQSIYDASDIKKGTLQKNGFPKYISGYDKPGPHQGNFVNNGIIGADRAWTAKLTEVKAVYQNVNVESRTEKRVRFQNGFSFLNLRDFALEWELLEDGKPIENSVEDMPTCAPGAIASLEIPYTTTISSGHEYLLNLSVKTKEAMPWAEQGYAIAQMQLPLNTISRSELPEKTTESEPLILTEGTRITVKNSNTALSFSKDGIYSWSYNGRPLIRVASGPEFYDYRYVENDEPYGNAESYNQDPLVGEKKLTYDLAADGSSCTITIQAEGEKAPYTYIYILYADGTLDMKATYYTRAYDLRRLGFGMRFPVGLENVSYYGRGPWSNFIDRRDGTPLGIYSSTVTDLFEPFSRPQTTGTHGDLRWLELTDAAGNGLHIETAGDVEFSLLHYDDRDMKAVRHNWELSPANFVYAHFDIMQKGVGNSSCGPATLSKYCIPTGKTFTHSLRFTPIDVTQTSIAKVNAESGISIRRSGTQLYAEGNLSAGTTMEVFNLGGVRVASKTNSAASNRMALDLGQLPRASYIVVVKTSTEKRVHKILVGF